MLAIEPLSSCNWIQSMVVGASDRTENHIYVIE